MVKEKKVFYRSKDTTNLCGILTMPHKATGYVILAHGITMDKNEWANFYVDVAQELCKKDFGSLRFDFRGHGESEGHQKDITIFGESLDVDASVEKLSEIWEGGISIIATSFGAGPAILYASKNKEKVKCLVLLCPVIDYVATFLKPITPWAKETFNDEGFKQLKEKGYILLDGEFKLGAKLIEEFKTMRPHELLRDVKCPVLTIHGNKDTMVPFRISKQYGVPNDRSEFMTLKGADHGFVAFGDELGDSKNSIKNKKIVIDKVTEWIEKWG